MRSAARGLSAVLALAAGAALAVPSGHRWFNPGTNGVPWPPTYSVYAHTGINNLASGFSTNVLPVVRESYAHWTSTEVACTSFQFNYGGTYTSPSGLQAVSGNDGANRMIWLGGNNWRYSNSTLGVTTTSWYQGSGQLFDADMEMNNNIPWKLGGPGQFYDVESITTHEAGHFIGLDHTPQTQAVMTPYYNVGDIKATLDVLDVNDVCGVYPATSASGAQGSPCTSDGNCAGGLKCRGASASNGYICTKECGAGITCPAGTTCQAAKTPTGGNVQACLVPVGSPDLCRFCTSGQDCSSGICLTDRNNRVNYCSLSCLADTQCGPGYVCYNQTYCVPAGTACPTPQCTGSAQCATGYACISGMCTATGNAGDRCDVSRYCATCTLCIGDEAEATCMACCGGNNQGGACNACASTSCAGGTTCLSLVNSQNQPIPDRVCVPGGSAACASCASNSDCQSGLTCYAGRCHPPCNPGANNTCSQKACYAIPGTSQGVCACSNEIATVGQSCGQSGSTLKVCSNGALCVGSPSVCRIPCTANSCGGGESCQVVSGKSVCVPDTGGGACAACVSGTCAGGDLTCLGGRCYKRCDTQAPVCGSTCVPTSGTAGVCGCPDAQQLEGGACGLVAGIPFSCANNGVCIEGRCRLPCGATRGCDAGFTCTGTSQGEVCLPEQPGSGGGSGGGAGGGAAGGSGGAGVPVNTAGCGCGAGRGAAALPWLALAMVWTARRRRGVQGFRGGRS